MQKPFLSFGEQITYLETTKKLTIQDTAYAEAMLKRIGYFTLIGGYKQPFKNPTTRNYKDGVRFEDIVALFFLTRIYESFF